MLLGISDMSYRRSSAALEGQCSPDRDPAENIDARSSAHPDTRDLFTASINLSPRMCTATLGALGLNDDHARRRVGDVVGPIPSAGTGSHDTSSNSCLEVAEAAGAEESSSYQEGQATAEFIGQDCLLVRIQDSYIRGERQRSVTHYQCLRVLQESEQTTGVLQVGRSCAGLADFEEKSASRHSNRCWGVGGALNSAQGPEGN